MKHLFASLLAVILLVGACPDAADACIVCLPMPQKTAADALIESQLVVFAREDPDKLFSYKAVEILKGDLEATSIDLFVNSTTRRVLKANEKRVAVLVRKDKGSPWRNLGIADEFYQQVVRRILAFAPQWKGKAGAERRCEFFLTLFGHENRALFELAYLELGRAPYSTIKRVARLASMEDLRPLFQRREYVQWRPLAILILAQKANAQNRKYIENGFDDCSRFSLTTNLGAWATAYIELNKALAVERIEREYLSNPDRTREEVRVVLMALSVHARDGHTQLRDQIARGCEIAVKNHPDVAEQIAEWEKVEGRRSKVEGRRSKVEGRRSKVEGRRSKVEGRRSKVEGRRSKVEGRKSKVNGR